MSTNTRADVSIRPRRPEDLPVLAEVLAAQRPHSDYPQRWPLPMPVEEFLARDAELAAWVAEIDGVVVGHVAAAAVQPGDLAAVWSAGTGLSLVDLAEVSVLFVDHAAWGTGVGGILLRTAVEHIRGEGLRPVLDVVQETENAVRLYERRGWVVVGEARPPWLPDTHRPVLLMTLPDEA